MKPTRIEFIKKFDGGATYVINEQKIDILINKLNPNGKTGLYLAGQENLFRNITSEEVEKLQGLPVGYSEGLSDMQRKKCIGNGFQVDTITHILKGIK